MVGRGNDVIDLLPPYSSKTSRATGKTADWIWMPFGMVSGVGRANNYQNLFVYIKVAARQT